MATPFTLKNLSDVEDSAQKINRVSASTCCATGRRSPS